jgi:hypothetical protein
MHNVKQENLVHISANARVNTVDWQIFTMVLISLCSQLKIFREIKPIVNAIVNFQIYTSIMALNCIQIRHAGALYTEQLYSQLISALFRHDFSDFHYDKCANI